MSSPFRGFVANKKFTKPSAVKMKLIKFSIAHACFFRMLKYSSNSPCMFTKNALIHACLQRIYQCGPVYLHFTNKDIYICYNRDSKTK